jgi:hypothetical protein
MRNATLERSCCGAILDRVNRQSRAQILIPKRIARSGEIFCILVYLFEFLTDLHRKAFWRSSRLLNPVRVLSFFSLGRALDAKLGHG